MREASVSTTLTVYYDGQFWVGVVERVEDGAFSAARTIFGSEPSDEEVLQFVLHRWDSLRFSGGVPAEKRATHARSPKRRKREAAKATSASAPGTKAQQAIAQMREESKRDAKTSRAERKRIESVRKYSLRRDKRKKKHRGH